MFLKLLIVSAEEEKKLYVLKLYKVSEVVTTILWLKTILVLAESTP